MTTTRQLGHQPQLLRAKNHDDPTGTFTATPLPTPTPQTAVGRPA